MADTYAGERQGSGRFNDGRTAEGKFNPLVLQMAVVVRINDLDRSLLGKRVFDINLPGICIFTLDPSDVVGGVTDQTAQGRVVQDLGVIDQRRILKSRSGYGVRDTKTCFETDPERCRNCWIRRAGLCKAPMSSEQV